MSTNYERGPDGGTAGVRTGGSVGTMDIGNNVDLAKEAYDVGQQLAQRIQAIGMTTPPAAADWSFICNHYQQIWEFLQKDVQFHSRLPTNFSLNPLR